MGGAIALGHPLGATGAIRAATVVHALRQRNLKYGMVTMCVGMGQARPGSSSGCDMDHPERLRRSPRGRGQRPAEPAPRPLLDGMVHASWGFRVARWSK